MKVTLLYPPETSMHKQLYTKKIFKFYSKVGAVLPPLNLAYIASYIRSKGYEVMLLDANVLNLNYKEIIFRLKNFNPDVILYTMVTFDFFNTLHWIQNIKKEINVPTIIGGPHLSIFPKETLSYDAIDYAVIGEGWDTIIELLDSIEHNKNKKNIKGLVYKKDNKIIKNEERPWKTSLDNVPFPARDLLPNEKYNAIITKKKPITTMIAGSGCPFQCAYCFSTPLIFRSAKNIVDEMEECVNKYGIKEIMFYDETFTLNKKRVIETMDEIRKRKLDVIWGIRTRPDTVDEEIIRKMAENGCIRINFGIESGDIGILKNINRITTPEQAKKAVEWSHKYGIETFGFFMLGCPEDTVETINKTIQLAIDLDLDFAQFTKLTIRPNTLLYAQMKKETGTKYWEDWILGKENNDEMTAYRSYVKGKELDYWFSQAYKKFYLRPHYVSKKLKHLRSPSEFINLLKSGLAVISN